MNLLTAGRSFILEKVNNDKEKDILSFSILIGFIIGAFHVISFSLAITDNNISSKIALAFIAILGSALYTSLVFAKSSFFYYLLGMYKEKESLIGAGKIFKINLLSSYPFLLLPAFALIARSIDNFALFILLYIITLIWCSAIKYKLFKSVLKINNYFFKVTYIIPAIIQFSVIISLIAIVLLGNILIIKSFIENIVKNILAALKLISG
jgi:hypothetical protein